MHENGEERLDLAIARKSGFSRAFVQGQIGQGRVRVDGTVATKASQRVAPGARIDCDFDDRPTTTLEPVAASLRILYEDDVLLVLDKDAHVTVHPAPGTQGATLVHHLLHHLAEASDWSETTDDPTRPGIVHRLDRGTSGCLVVAKTRLAQERLSAQFKDRTVRKVYEALAWGALPERGLWDSPIGRDRNNRKKMSSRSEAPRPALTAYERLETFGHAVHVRLYPKTGRTHQLRVHLSENGNAIVGDATYGGRLGNRALDPRLRERLERLDRPLLHAAELELAHPVRGERLVFRAPRPTDFDECLAAFRAHDPTHRPFDGLSRAPRAR
jgi:23S rRNA pseudouridine1911/1915/1917 synthase